MTNTCGHCGKNPSEGFAWIGDTWFCSGPEKPSCFDLAGAEEARLLRELADVQRRMGER